MVSSPTLASIKKWSYRVYKFFIFYISLLLIIWEMEISFLESIPEYSNLVYGLMTTILSIIMLVVIITTVRAYNDEWGSIDKYLSLYDEIFAPIAILVQLLQIEMTWQIAFSILIWSYCIIYFKPLYKEGKARNSVFSYMVFYIMICFTFQFAIFNQFSIALVLFVIGFSTLIIPNINSENNQPIKKAQKMQKKKGIHPLKKSI